MRSVLSAVLVGAAAMLCGAGPAHAALYQGNWDPAYGGIFPQLGWQASALFDVPESCLALGNAVNVPISGSCAGFDVLSAKVELYNVGDSETMLGSYDLNPNVNVTGINITGGQLSGIDTGYFGYFVPPLSIAGEGEYSFHLILFGGNKAQLVYTKPIETSPGCVPFGVEGAVCGSSQNVATGVFTPVNAIPEPETYALLLAGLGAVSFVARRRRR
ncbi:MAG TPA: FxDxF family PEP-CTERM protein [Caldimonas sp.]|nr:FxDxF family PEP-CTERM protein [Caldimonas sp.]HEX2542449.1 FxDxF family PEP-CTERM protein [Caldimonas sp.]